MELGHKLVDVVVVAVLDAGADPFRPRGPQAVAHPSLGEARDLDAIGERALAAASNPPCSCDANPPYTDRITDCIRRTPQPCPKPTI